MPPIYDYACTNKKCNHEFEVFYTSQSKVKEEEPEEKCPKCGSKKKRKLPPKGTGFVVNCDGFFKKHNG